MLRAGRANAVDDKVGDLVAMIGRVEPPIDPDRRRAIDLDPARYDDPFLIGLAPQHLEAFAAEGAEGGGIADDDIILVKSDELLPLRRRRFSPICPESKTGAGFHVEILTEQLAELLLLGRRRVRRFASAAMARLPRSPTKLAGSFVAAKLLGVSPMMLENRTKADSSKKRCIILNLQRRSCASVFRRLRLTCAPEEAPEDYRAENSHQAVRRRKRKTQRVKSARRPSLPYYETKPPIVRRLCRNNGFYGVANRP